MLELSLCASVMGANFADRPAVRHMHTTCYSADRQLLWKVGVPHLVGMQHPELRPSRLCMSHCSHACIRHACFGQVLLRQPFQTILTSIL
jgi:hypothetical protein